jgi:hypothetical protein
MKSYIIGLLTTTFFVLFSSAVLAQEKQYKVACVGFYNLENLFDTVDDPNKRDEDFTPDGSYSWGDEKYKNKLKNMAHVIEDMGKEISPDGMAILGVCEVENRKVLEDLVQEQKIKGRDYQIIHEESPDRRGIDVGLLYQAKYFTPTNFKSYELKFPDNPDYFTRDQLVVSGTMDGDHINIIVAHWPSRSGGQAKSEPRRIQAAQLGRKIIDSLLAVDPSSKIILMGDLNDDPVNKSVKDYIRAKAKVKKMKDGDMYNTMYDKYKQGDCTLAYRDAWNLFDQLIISEGLTGNDCSSFVFHKSYVYNKPYLRQKEGLYKGYPKRTHAGGKYLNGYSDHFPVYLVLKKEVK